MNTELLRPFDLDAAKAGDLLTDSHGKCLWSYVAGPDIKGKYVLMVETGAMKGEFAYPLYTSDVLRMQPLCWCEGKPVYKGDHLWQGYGNGEKLEVIASHACKVDATTYLEFTNGYKWSIDGSINHLTWAKPKTKKSGWMNIYSDYKVRGPIYSTKEEADHIAESNRTDCVEVHWEE